MHITGGAARFLPFVAAVALAFPRQAITQTPDGPPRPAAAPAAGAQESTGADFAPEELDAIRQRLSQSPWHVTLPPSGEISRGNRRIGAGESISGSVATAGGTLEILGTVEGDAIALEGDVVVLEGGLVRRDAVSVGGQVRLDGGRVEREIRRLNRADLDGASLAPGAPHRSHADHAEADLDEEAAPAPLSRRAATKRAISIAMAGLVMLALIGMGVLIFAGDHLNGVVAALERQFGRAFLFGIAGQLAIVPVLIILVVALAATVVGILVIPIVAFGYVLIVGGALALGLLAVAKLTGSALLGPGEPGLAGERRAALRGLMVGILIFTGLWIVAAAFTFTPVLGGLLRGIAAVVTWVVLTAGLGATLLTRMGTRRAAKVAPVMPTVHDDIAWATPTPVSGIAAARRPGPAARSGSGEGI